MGPVSYQYGTTEEKITHVPLPIFCSETAEVFYRDYGKKDLNILIVPPGL